MPAMEKTKTYMPFPPPPLPQFYLNKPRVRHEVSTVNTTSKSTADRDILVIKEEVSAVDGTHDIKPSISQLGPPPSKPLIAMPITGTNPQDIPPLAIYHICRICLRPRSPRYHREHPIPLEGFPPPPGICRRCRVTKVVDTKTVDLVYEDRSNRVKLGFLTPFMKDEDVVNQEEIRKMKVEQLLRGSPTSRVTVERSTDHRKGSCYEGRSKGRRTSDSRKDVKQRVIYVTADEQSKDETFDMESEQKVDERKVAFRSSQKAIEAYNNPPSTRIERTARTSMELEPTEQSSVPSQRACENSASKNRNVKITTSTNSSSDTSKTGSSSTAQASARLAVPPLGPTRSEVGRIVREELDRYAEAFKKQQWTTSDIRKVSGEEVERYRAAERKIESHHDAFAHGRLVPIVPVERRIEVEKDSPAETLWEQSKKDRIARVEISTKRNAKNSTASEADWERTKVTVNAHSRGGGPKQSNNLSADPASAVSSGYNADANVPSAQDREKDEVRSRFEGPPWDFNQAKNATTKVSVKSDRADQSFRCAQMARRDDAVWERQHCRSENTSQGLRSNREVLVERRRSTRSGEETALRSGTQAQGHDISKVCTSGVPREQPSGKVRQIYEDVQETNPPPWPSSAEPQDVRSAPLSQLDRHSVIEVIEEADVQPRLRTVSYRRSDKGDLPRSLPKHQQRKQFPTDTDIRGVQVSQHKHTSRDHRPYDDETWSSGTSLGDRGTPANRCTVKSQSTSRSSAPRPSKTPECTEHEISFALPACEQSRDAWDSLPIQRSDEIRWNRDNGFTGENAAESSTRESRLENKGSTRWLEDGSMPGRTMTEKETRTHRAASRGKDRHSNSDIEYIYTERIVTPSDRPLGWRPSELKVIEEEEMHVRGSDRLAPSQQ